MLIRHNYNNRSIKTKAAWIRGKKNNQAAIPVEIAQIQDVVFVIKDFTLQLAYEVEYEDGNVGYIFFDELEFCETFALETKIDKSTLS